MWRVLYVALGALWMMSAAPVWAAADVEFQEWMVPPGAGPHDVAPARDGGVWFTAQSRGYLGWLDPGSGEIRQIPLGRGSLPHGVIVGPDGAPWVTDGGQNAIVRVDPATYEVQVFPLGGRNVNLNTATFDLSGTLWFTGQNGVFGRLVPGGQPSVVEAPRGAGPYGITTTPLGQVYYASLAGNHIAQVNLETAESVPFDPPTPRQGARRVWPDSRGNVWVSEWDAGQVGRFDPQTGMWREWRLPGARPQAYAVYVDEHDMVWLSDWGSNALVRFDPAVESFDVFPFSQPHADVRQLHGRPGEVWGAMSGARRIFVARTGRPQSSP